MSNIVLPSFSIDKLPNIRVKSINLNNFKVFNNYTFDFMDNRVENTPKKFICFIGPNGCGKSTVLSAIQLIFSNFNEMDETRLYFNLGKLVRHADEITDHTLTKDDFLITAQLSSSVGDYEIQINRNGFIKDHPQEIKELAYRLCYFTRFDQELRNFQLNRSKWEVFKKLFEAITGFEIEEQKNKFFNESDDPTQADLLKRYVLNFLVHKPKETITQRECSDGERKIIKSFSTLLNVEYMPQLILIDNVEMHVEASRHLNLISQLKSCYPDSQILTTTHSYNISKNFSDRNQIYDLRIIGAKDIIREEPWRLYIIDEIKDGLTKLNGLSLYGQEALLKEGDSLIEICNSDFSSAQIELHQLRNRVKAFLADVNSMYIDTLTNN